MIGKHFCKSIAMISLGVVAMLFFSACGGSENERIAAVEDRQKIPALDATSVTTVVSDSGITRYRIATEKWLVYDKAKEPYWHFPEGILLENFTSDLEVDASVVGDTAIFLEKKQIWELKGNVVAHNIEGEKFETEQLFWNQKTERIYSDSLIKITRESSIIIGTGFNSNQSMTQYVITKPHGVFPVKDKNDSTATDSTEMQPIQAEPTHEAPMQEAPIKLQKNAKLSLRKNAR